MQGLPILDEQNVKEKTTATSRRFTFFFPSAAITRRFAICANGCGAGVTLFCDHRVDGRAHARGERASSA
jgi:hypothetical protein